MLDQLAQNDKIQFPDKPDDAPKLRVYLSESKGTEIGSVWDDIEYMPSERGPFGEEAIFVGPRPLALLNRIVLMASDPGDLILDPFCGTGTTLVATHQTGRKWVACDKLPEACFITLRRLETQCGLRQGVDFQFVAQEELERLYPAVGRTYKRLVTVEDLTGEIKPQFVLGQPVEIEETRYYEFKEIKGSGAVDAIRNIADEYAVAFLNSYGGRIFWGIRNSDRAAVGVILNSEQRDKLRRLVVEKLSTIQPPISPDFYRLELHPVYDPQAKSAVPDLYVVELTVPRPATRAPYSTGSGAFFDKTESGIQEIKGQRLREWLRQFTDEE